MDHFSDPIWQITRDTADAAAREAAQFPLLNNFGHPTFSMPAQLPYQDPYHDLTIGAQPPPSGWLHPQDPYNPHEVIIIFDDDEVEPEEDPIEDSESEEQDDPVEEPAEEELSDFGLFPVLMPEHELPEYDPINALVYEDESSNE